ncbi:hypothetical protein JCM1840_006677 [Sporobolomyces johnsonii]
MARLRPEVDIPKKRSTLTASSKATKARPAPKPTAVSSPRALPHRDKVLGAVYTLARKREGAARSKALAHHKVREAVAGRHRGLAAQSGFAKRIMTAQHALVDEGALITVGGGAVKLAEGVSVSIKSWKEGEDDDSDDDERAAAKYLQNVSGKPVTPASTAKSKSKSRTRVSGAPKSKPLKSRAVSAPATTTRSSGRKRPARTYDSDAGDDDSDESDGTTSRRPATRRKSVGATVKPPRARTSSRPSKRLKFVPSSPRAERDDDEDEDQLASDEDEASRKKRKTSASQGGVGSRGGLTRLTKPQLLERVKALEAEAKAKEAESEDGGEGDADLAQQKKTLEEKLEQAQAQVSAYKKRLQENGEVVSENETEVVSENETEEDEVFVQAAMAGGGVEDEGMGGIGEPGFDYFDASEGFDSAFYPQLDLDGGADSENDVEEVEGALVQAQLVGKGKGKEKELPGAPRHSDRLPSPAPSNHDDDRATSSSRRRPQPELHISEVSRLPTPEAGSSSPVKHVDDHVDRDRQPTTEPSSPIVGPERHGEERSTQTDEAQAGLARELEEIKARFEAARQDEKVARETKRAVQAELDLVCQRYQDLAAATSASEADAEAARQEANRRRAELQDAHAKAQQLTAQCNRLEEQTDELGEELRKVQEAESGLDERLKDIEGKLAAERDALKKEKQACAIEVEELKRDQSTITELSHENADLATEKERLVEELASAEALQEKLQGHLEYLQNEIEQTKTDRDESASSLLAAQENEQRAYSVVATLEEDLKQAHDRERLLVLDQRGLETQVEQLKLEASTAFTELQKAQEALDALTVRIRQLGSSCGLPIDRDASNEALCAFLIDVDNACSAQATRISTQDGLLNSALKLARDLVDALTPFTGQTAPPTLDASLADVLGWVLRGLAVVTDTARSTSADLEQSRSQLDASSAKALDLEQRLSTLMKKLGDLAVASGGADPPLCLDDLPALVDDIQDATFQKNTAILKGDTEVNELAQKLEQEVEGKKTAMAALIEKDRVCTSLESSVDDLQAKLVATQQKLAKSERFNRRVSTFAQEFAQEYDEEDDAEKEEQAVEPAPEEEEAVVVEEFVEEYVEMLAV